MSVSGVKAGHIFHFLHFVLHLIEQPSEISTPTTGQLTGKKILKNTFAVFYNDLTIRLLCLNFFQGA
jgi:hypothetical protein